MLFLILACSQGIVGGPGGKSVYITGEACVVNADNNTNELEYLAGLEFCRQQWQHEHNSLDFDPVISTPGW